MKKFLVSALAMFVLVSFGSVFAQTLDTADHTVTVDIPEVAFLRFTDTVGSRGAYIGDLDLEFELDVADVEAGDPIVRTNAGATWGDLKVFVNRAIAWTVTVGVVQDMDANSTLFPWANIGTAAFDIDGDTIDTGSTNGWHSLGFGATDLQLTLNGTELAGIYKATVTYTLTTP